MKKSNLLKNLTIALVAKWEQIPAARLQNLDRRVEAVIKALMPIVLE